MFYLVILGTTYSCKHTYCRELGLLYSGDELLVLPGLGMDADIDRVLRTCTGLEPNRSEYESLLKRLVEKVQKTQQLGKVGIVRMTPNLRSECMDAEDDKCFAAWYIAVYDTVVCKLIERLDAVPNWTANTFEDIQGIIERVIAVNV